MFSAAAHFNLYVTGAGSDEARRASLLRLVALYPLATEHQAAFAHGDRILLLDGVSDEEAKRATSSLRALGLRVDLEEQHGALAMVEIDGYTQDEPATAPVAPQENFFFNVNAGLVGLDGEDDAPVAPRPAPPAPLPAGLPGLFGGEVNATLRDADEGQAPSATSETERPLALPAAARSPGHSNAAPSPVAVHVPDAPVRPGGAERFGPNGPITGPIEIQMDGPARDPMLSVPEKGNETVVVPRCPTHDVPKIGSRCPRCDAEDALVRGRLFGGALRSRLPLRVGIGLFGGLLVGWIATAPLARRAERQVAYIREEARLERTRPLEAAQAHAAELDTQADEESQRAFFRTLGVWTLIAGAITAGWFRLT